MNIVFAGTPEYAAQHLQGLLESKIPISAVVTQPDKPGKRGKKLVPSAVKQLAQEVGLPILQPAKFSAADLADLNCDLLVVVAYGQILRQSLLDTPTFGCINVHGSILPRWRGAAPIQRAIEAGDRETGICIMQMDAGLDTGPVMYEARLPADPANTSHDLSEKLVPLGVEGLLQVIKQIKENSTTLTPQPSIGATYAKKIEKSEAKLDWSMPTQNLVQKIQAFNPDPVCYCELNQSDKNMRMKIYRAQVFEELSDSGPTPGTIIDVRPTGIVVSTIDGAILLQQIQLPLGKGSILSGRDVLNARTDILHKGVSLG